MSTVPNDAAFCGPAPDGYAKGLTKREYFAGLAMQGMLANSAFFELLRKNVKADDHANFLVTAAIEQADVLIELLNKEEVSA